MITWFCVIYIQPWTTLTNRKKTNTWDITKLPSCIFFDENCSVFIQISFSCIRFHFVLKGAINHTSALVRRRFVVIRFNDAYTCHQVKWSKWTHYNDVIMSAVASQTTSLTIVYSTVYSGVDQRKHQSLASLAFVWGIRRWPVNSSQKGPVTR